MQDSVCPVCGASGVRSPRFSADQAAGHGSGGVDLVFVEWFVKIVGKGPDVEDSWDTLIAYIGGLCFQVHFGLHP